MRIFYNQSVDAIARRLVPGIAVAALAAWGVASGGAVLEEIPELASPSAQAANLGSGSGSAVGAAADAGSWQDGTWTGTAQGYGGDVTVSVTIANKKITAIEVVSASGETPSFFSKAKALIPKIIEAQNPDVDVVSGATYSSNGIINAVKNALTKASGGTVTETSNGGGAAANTATGSTSSDAFQDGTYKDGTYTGSAAGFQGNITVSVTISGGKIASINVVSAPGNDEPYLSKAKTLIAKVIAKQSPNGVDTVSGATYSSNGILNAIKQALKKAQTSGGTTTTTDDNDDKKTTEKTYTDTETEFYGIGYGFHNGRIVLKVTASGGELKGIDVIEKNDQDEPYFTNASKIIEKVKNGKNINVVDTVSGATYSSKGILTALTEALNKAIIAEQYIPPKDTPTPEPTPDPEAQTYTETVSVNPDEDDDFYAYELIVDVSVKDGKVESVSVNKDCTIEKSNVMYSESAFEGMNTNLSGKTAADIDGVDTVSRATCSSKAIKEAVKQALAKAEG